MPEFEQPSQSPALPLAPPSFTPPAPAIDAFSPSVPPPPPPSAPTRPSLRRRGAPVVGALIGINVGIWLAMVASGASPISPATGTLLRWGADFGMLTLEGEWWRTLTATFLHIGFWHLFMNMIVLWMIGRRLEPLIGSRATLAIYLLTGVSANLVSTHLQPEVINAGASGAIMGLFGAFWGLLIRGRLNLSRGTMVRLNIWAAVFMFVQFWDGFRAGNVNNVAHLAGAGGGLLFGLILAEPRRFATERGFRLRLRWTAAAFAVAMAAGVFWPGSPARFLAAADHAERIGDPADALRNYDRYLKARPDDAEALVGRARARIRLRQFDGARADLNRAVSIDGNAALPHVERARFLLMQGEVAAASSDLRAALEADPNDLDALDLTAYLASQQGDLKQARAAWSRVLELEPQDAATMIELAGLEIRMGDGDSALVLLDRARQIEPENPLIWSAEASIWVDRGIYYKALDLENHAFGLARRMRSPEVRPIARHILFERAFIHYHLGENGAAASDWRNAAGLSTDAYDKAGTLENLGLIYARQGAWRAALHNCDLVDALDPDMAWNALFRSIAADQLGDAAMARSAYARWLGNRTDDDPEQLRPLLPPTLRPYLTSFHGEAIEPATADAATSAPAPTPRPAATPEPIDPAYDPNTITALPRDTAGGRA